MVRKTNQMRVETRENMRGGNGAIDLMHLFEQEMVAPKGRLCAKLTIKSGCSIGSHTHGPDAEIYIVTKGSLKVDDNGTPCVLEAGDVMYTANGEAHSVTNDSGEDAEMLAIVLE